MLYEKNAKCKQRCMSWGIYGSIKYGLILVLVFNGELQIADHYLRPLSESYINI